MLVAKLTAVFQDEFGRDRAQPLRVERQERLQALQGIHGEQAEHVEQQHGNGVDLPVHLFVGLHARKAIDQAFDRAQDRVEERALALVDAGHERAQRLGQQQAKPRYKE